MSHPNCGTPGNPSVVDVYQHGWAGLHTKGGWFVGSAYIVSLFLFSGRLDEQAGEGPGFDAASLCLFSRGRLRQVQALREWKEACLIKQPAANGFLLIQQTSLDVLFLPELG
eukprot:scaffold217181_cov18-Tisochrysis_lutea.AAC.1